MKIIIDTSSWVALVRYYLPFDTNETLPSLIEEKIINNEVIVLDKVYLECKYLSKGIVVENLPFIKENQVKTDELIPSKKFYNSLENQFCNQMQKKMLTETEFENRKQTFLNSADAKILLRAINYSKIDKEEVIIVTEETSSNNDSKVFKKIPILSSHIGIRCITLPELISLFNTEIGLNIFKNSKTGQQTTLF